MLLELSREGIAGVWGVWGVCGEIAFPGEDDVEKDVPATIGGTPPERCLLDELEDRCNNREDDIESERAVFESLIRWKRVKAAFVLRVDASTSVGLRRSFL